MTCHGEKASYDLSFFSALRQRREDAKGESPGYAARLRLRHSGAGWNLLAGIAISRTSDFIMAKS